MPRFENSPSPPAPELAWNSCEEQIEPAAGSSSNSARKRRLISCEIKSGCRKQAKPQPQASSFWPAFAPWTMNSRSAPASAAWLLATFRFPVKLCDVGEACSTRTCHGRERDHSGPARQWKASWRLAPLLWNVPTLVASSCLHGGFSRLRGNDNEAHSGTTAIAWISIFARSSISAATCIAVIVG